MRSHPGLLAAAVLSILACEPKPKVDEGKTKTEDQTKTEQPDPDADPGEDEQVANFAQPTARPPKAPEGSITLKDPWLYVQTCAEPHPCPSLKQPAGVKHCRELQLGGYASWRLPSKDEVPRFKGAAGLEATAGYHWTRTPYKEDLGQVWIVDPENPTQAPSTTIPRERKAFRVRCVKEP